MTDTPHDNREIPYGLLPDWAIRRYVGISPFAEGKAREGIISYGLSSYGYDVRLGRKFKLFTNTHNVVVDPKKVDPKSFVDLEDDVCVIPPNSYVLGESVEHFIIPRDVSCVVVGKSTYARNAIIVNVTPLEADWRGHITIEISNCCTSPVKVYANEGIMQVLFIRAAAPCDVSYADKKGKYQSQSGLTLARVDGVPFVN